MTNANNENKANATNDKATDKKDFKAFIQSISKDGKAPSFITPKDLATWFDRDDRKVRDALRKQGIYATETKQGKGHFFGLGKDELKATKGLFDYMASRFDSTSNGATSRGRSYLEIDWNDL